MEEIKKKRKQVEEELRERKHDFERLRKVTQVPEVRDLPQHSTFLE